jgi:hypothetical protein
MMVELIDVDLILNIKREPKTWAMGTYFRDITVIFRFSMLLSLV